MASEAQSTEHELLKTGLAVGFRIVGEEVLTALDEAELPGTRRTVRHARLPIL